MICKPVGIVPKNVVELFSRGRFPLRTTLKPWGHSKLNFIINFSTPYRINAHRRQKHILILFVYDICELYIDCMWWPPVGKIQKNQIRREWFVILSQLETSIYFKEYMELNFFVCRKGMLFQINGIYCGHV